MSFTCHPPELTFWMHSSSRILIQIYNQDFKVNKLEGPPTHLLTNHGKILLDASLYSRFFRSLFLSLNIRINLLRHRTSFSLWTLKNLFVLVSVRWAWLKFHAGVLSSNSGFVISSFSVYFRIGRTAAWPQLRRTNPMQISTQIATRISVTGAAQSLYNEPKSIELRDAPAASPIPRDATDLRSANRYVFCNGTASVLSLLRYFAC